VELYWEINRLKLNLFSYNKPSSPVAGYEKDFLGPKEHLNDNCLFYQSFSFMYKLFLNCILD